MDLDFKSAAIVRDGKPAEFALGFCPGVRDISFTVGTEKEYDPRDVLGLDIPKILKFNIRKSVHVFAHDELYELTDEEMNQVAITGNYIAFTTTHYSDKPTTKVYTKRYKLKKRQATFAQVVDYIEDFFLKAYRSRAPWYGCPVGDSVFFQGLRLREKYDAFSLSFGS